MKYIKNYISKYKTYLLKDQLEPYDIHNKIINNLQLKGSPVTTLFLASIVASIGLNIDSVFVVIGAKLMSPLMLLITSMGYGISVFEFKIFKKAFQGLIIQFVIILVASTIYFILSPNKIVTNQLITKTTVSIFDILIAFFAGACGILAFTRIEKNNVLPGVAIATSLLPPVCTMGYGIATLNTKFIIGPFLLFFANVFFIILATIVVCNLFSLEKQVIPTKESGKKTRKMFMISTFIISIPIIIYCTIFLFKSYKEASLDTSLNSFVENEINVNGDYMIKTKLDSKNKTIDIFLLGDYITTDKQEELKNIAYSDDFDGYDIKFIQDKDKVLVELLK